MLYQYTWNTQTFSKCWRKSYMLIARWCFELFWTIQEVEPHKVANNSLLILVQTFQIRRKRHVEYFSGYKEKFISDDPLWTPTPVLVNLQWIVFISSVQTLGGVKRTYGERWPIMTDDESEKESSESGLAVRLVDDELNQSFI